jgi:hypothetical protein
VKRDGSGNFSAGSLTLSGTSTAGYFSGNGGGLTNLPASTVAGIINPTNLPVYSYLLSTNWASTNLSRGGVMGTPINVTIPSGTYQIQLTMTTANTQSDNNVGVGYSLSGNAASINEVETAGQPTNSMTVNFTTSALGTGYLVSNIHYTAATISKSPVFSYTGFLKVTNNCTYTATVGVNGTFTDQVTVYQGSGVVLTRIK